MAQFQRGSKKSLERKLGIMYGSVGAEDCDPYTILTLRDGRELITEKVREGSISEADGESIYLSMTNAGVFEDLQAVANHILNVTTPEGLTSEWKLAWGECDGDDCEGDHLVLTNEKLDMKVVPNDDTFYSVLDLCDDLFRDEMMTSEEAVWALKKALEKLPLESEDGRPSSTN